MSKFKLKEIRELADFNPPEKVPVGKTIKKIPMGYLKEFKRKISGYELAEFKSGPKFRNGDTLVAKITPCLENGKTAFVDILDDNEVAFGSSEFIVLRAKKGTNAEFLYYLSKSPTFRKRAIDCMEGTSGRKRVNEGVLKLFELPVPDKEQQDKIASVLSVLDKKIELNNRINSELEAMAKTLYDYWFVQFDFPTTSGVNKGKPYKSSGGKMVYNATLKREIPEGWGGGKLIDIANITTGKLDSNAEVLDGKYLFFTCAADPTTIDNYEYDDNVILIAGNNAQGNFHINRFSGKFNAYQRTYIITSKAVTQLDYLYQVLSSHVKLLKKMGNGSLTKFITINMLTDAPIFKRNLNVMDEFHKVSSPLYKKQTNISYENKQLTQLRDWLLPMLMNGQVSVGE